MYIANTANNALRKQKPTHLGIKRLLKTVKSYK